MAGNLVPPGVRSAVCAWRAGTLGCWIRSTTGHVATWPPTRKTWPDDAAGWRGGSAGNGTCKVLGVGRVGGGFCSHVLKGEGPATPAVMGGTAWGVSDFPGRLNLLDPDSGHWLAWTTFGEATVKTFPAEVILESRCVATLSSETLAADSESFTLTCENRSSLLQEFFWPSDVCRITLVHWKRCWDAEECVCRGDSSVEFQFEFPGRCESAAEGGWVASNWGGLYGGVRHWKERQVFTVQYRQQPNVPESQNHCGILSVK